MAEFQIKKGLSTNLIDENGVCLLPPEKLLDGCWYLTTDTAEIYVAIQQDGGSIELKKLNECNADIDFPEVESFEERLSALESREQIVTYLEYSQLPSIGSTGILYIVLDKASSYVYNSKDGYVCVGNTTSLMDIQVINGGTAKKTENM